MASKGVKKETLRTLSDQPLLAGDLEAYMKLISGESDRACALVASSFVEHSLVEYANHGKFTACPRLRPGAGARRTATQKFRGQVKRGFHHQRYGAGGLPWVLPRVGHEAARGQQPLLPLLRLRKLQIECFQLRPKR